ncbi:MAG: SprB repeat-containing protein [Sphingobacteriales bacterium]|nr:SprB repeat-containing protein [Sphingobacteriales bacterium]
MTIVPSGTPTCGGSNITLTATINGGTPPVTYSWSNGATGASISVGSGTYTVTVTDAEGCTGTATYSISIPSAPTVTIAASGSASCTGGTGGATLTANVTSGTAPYTYLWSTGATTQSISSVAAGTYTVTVKDSKGCEDEATYTVGTPNPPTASISATGSASCQPGTGGATLTASATGGSAPYTYMWSTGATTAAITVTAAGTYTVTVKDSKGCEDEVTYTLAPANAPTAAISATGTPGCNGAGNAQLTATATGGTAPYTYMWSTGATTASISGVAAGTYTVTVKDSKGCEDDATYTLTDPLAPTVSIAPTGNVTCDGEGGVTLTAAASGGKSPYTYLWRPVLPHKL